MGNVNDIFGLFTTHSFTNSSEVENPAIFHSWGENRVWMVCEDSYEVGFPFSQYVFEFKEQSYSVAAFDAFEELKINFCGPIGFNSMSLVKPGNA